MFNELKALIVGHRTFFCPITGKCLDVRRAVAFELSLEEENWSKIYGPYDKSASIEGVDIEQFAESMAAKHGAKLRVISG